MKLNRLLLLPLFLLFACSKEESFTPANYTVSGKVEKGPFVKGSTVTLESLDSQLSPLGNSLTTTVKNDEGHFDWGTLRLEAPYALLTARGHYFDELRGELSDEPITLQAIVDLSAQSTVNINLLTHLKTERLKRLIASGRSFAEANRQGQAELLESFALQNYHETDASRFSIAEGTDEAAALILISAALLRDRTEADFAKYITRLTKEFAFGGTFSDPVKEQYRYSTVNLRNRFGHISDHLVERYKQQGKTVTVKDLAYFVDWDEDGIAGNELGDPNVEKILEFETTQLDIPMQGGVYTVKIQANIPYSLTDPIKEGIYRALPYNPLFQETTISYRQELKQDVLTLNIAPAYYRFIQDEPIRLYSMDGKLHSSLSLKQQGNPAREIAFSRWGKEFFTDHCLRMANVLSYFHTEEGLYTQLYQSSDELWKGFKSLPLSPSDFMMNRSWGICYPVLENSQKAMALMNDAYASLLAPYLACADAAMYYEMAVMWGHVIYWQGVGTNQENKHQLKEKELFAKLAVPLKQGLAVFDEKMNQFEKVADMFALSKDVPRALLAKMHLYNKEYSQAYALFKEIVDTQHYQLESSRSNAMSRDCTEMIYGIFPPKAYSTSVDAPFHRLESEDARMPLATYAEVVLSLAECAYRLGDQQSAERYLNQVTKARNLTPFFGKKDFITSLQKVWASELKGTGTYFAFLKRNNLAQTLLELEEYMLLFPIPKDYIDWIPTIQQNPGYSFIRDDTGRH